MDPPRIHPANVHDPRGPAVQAVPRIVLELDKKGGAEEVSTTDLQRSSSVYTSNSASSAGQELLHESLGLSGWFFVLSGPRRFARS